jgi:hypothetical protein
MGSGGFKVAQAFYPERCEGQPVWFWFSLLRQNQPQTGSKT